MSTMKVEFATSLPIADAKARLQALGEYLTNRHGIQVTWTGDSAAVKGKYMVVGIEGTLSFAGGKAVFEGKDPGFLWRGKAKDYLAGKFKTYLDPATRIEDLKRS